MATYNSPTLGALPFLLLLFKELSNANLLDGFQVLKHTHPIIHPVSLVDMAELPAGKIIAFITVFHLAIQE
jgi:hypothetical protein